MTGDTLAVFMAVEGEPPATNYATLNTRNSHLVLDFDTTTQEAIYFSGVLPRNYANGGITAYIHWLAATATSGTIGWGVSFENMSDGTDLDADSFATEQLVTAATVPATSGAEAITNVAIADGANLDSIAVGQAFRIMVRRDVANDNAAGDAQLLAVELKET